MVMGGVFGAICVVLGVSGIGMIPVPNLTGRATIMHVPVILAAVLEGPLIGGFTGLIMGVYSLMTASLVPDPIVTILPRILIGVVSGFVYKAFGRHHMLGAAFAGILRHDHEHRRLSGAGDPVWLSASGCVDRFAAAVHCRAHFGDGADSGAGARHPARDAKLRRRKKIKKWNGGKRNAFSL